AASALAASLKPDEYALAATGFRDTTRIAAGDPSLWTSILLENASEIVTGLRAYESLLTDFRRAIERRDATTIRDLLGRGRDNRDLWRRVFLEATETTASQISSEEANALGS
ncbi:MAG: prephenate dehydrogenase/arogenate dehydrogenase family protein, partial [Planctomycetaceae bacterium]